MLIFQIQKCLLQMSVASRTRRLAVVDNRQHCNLQNFQPIKYTPDTQMPGAKHNWTLRRDAAQDDTPKTHLSSIANEVSVLSST